MTPSRRSSSRFRRSASWRSNGPSPPHPPRLPSAAMTRWHGTINVTGLRPIAPPTARAARGAPTRARCRRSSRSRRNRAPGPRSSTRWAQFGDRGDRAGSRDHPRARPRAGARRWVARRRAVGVPDDSAADPALGTTSACRRRPTRSPKSSTEVSHSAATTPCAEVARWYGPYGPDRVSTARRGRSMASPSVPHGILPGSMSDRLDPAASPTREVVLPIEGMTCASCVKFRIERFLRQTPGVADASVNLATEMATIHYRPDDVGRARLVEAVEAAGYDVRERPGQAADAAPTSLIEELSAEDADRDREARALLRQALVSIGVAVAIMVAMFVPQTSIPMTTINWLALIPATVIQVWAGRRFYRSAWRAARHGTTNMDTLVAIGTTAAWGYSVVVTLAPQLIHEAGLHPETYFDSSMIILGLVLLGRWLESRAKTRTTGAIRRLVALQPTVARRLGATGIEAEIPLDQVVVGDRLRVRPAIVSRPRIIT